jgi:hypothetical protein
VTVHFQSIVEKFMPHDTIFTFTSATQLKDSKLSAACSLHTASASVKSSTDSLRPPPLSEIAEDAQDAPSESPDDSENHHREPSWAGDANRAQVALSRYSDLQDFTRVTSAKPTLSPAHSTRTVRNTDKALPLTPPEVDHRKVYSKSIYEGDDHDNRPSVDARFSFQSMRPATRDMPHAYEYKPKVKLGPRPSNDSAARSHMLESPRPVSTLPASVRIPTRKAPPTRPKSQHSQKPSHDMAPTKIALSPPLPIIPTSFLDASHTKGNGPATPTRCMQSKSPAITPEKRRLMKALQLRQKQLAAQARKSNFGRGLSPSEPEFGKAETIMDTRVDIPGMQDDYRKSGATITENNEESEIVQVFIDESSKSNFTTIESSPISVIEPSDGPSTQASSITDEDISKLESKPSAWEGPNRTSETNEESSHPPETEENADWKNPSTVPSRSGAKPGIADGKPVDPLSIPLPPADESEANDLKSPRISSGEEVATGSLVQSVTENHLPEICVVHLPERREDNSNATRPSTGDTFQEGGPSEVLSRHNNAISLKRASTPENSDDHFLSDDSFMEELRSATVQEAKPISVSVSKSPIAPVFPRRPSDHKLSEAGKYTRSVSNPIQGMRKEDQAEISPPSPTYFSPRSVSASHPSRGVPSEQASAMVLKKVGVSAGISQRIKALEQLSSRPTSPSSQGQTSVNSAGPSPAFVSLRKASLKSPPLRSDSGESMGSRIRQKLSSSSISSSPGGVYLNQKERPVIKIESKSKKSHSNSISVTATIIRDPRNKIPTGPVDLADPNVGELCQSPLVVEHQLGGRPSTQPPQKPPRSRFASPRSVSSSSTERRSETPHATRRDSWASKRSVTSGRGSEVELPQSISETSLNGVNGHDGLKEEKKESRKSRLFKRMSGISSASRRSIVQALNPSMKEEPIVEHYETVYEAPQAMAAFGDVNIQFPDTLVGQTGFLQVSGCANASAALEATRHEN